VLRAAMPGWRVHRPHAPRLSEGGVAVPGLLIASASVYVMRNHDRPGLFELILDVRHGDDQTRRPLRRGPRLEPPGCRFFLGQTRSRKR
jgi:hypothetical protein